MPKRIALTAGWVGAIAAAATIGVAAIGALRSEGSADPPLSQQDVDNALARSISPSTTAPTSSSPSPSAQTSAGTRKYVTTPGGTLWATCRADLATLNSISPGQGYRIDGKLLGPAPAAWVKFKLDVQHGHGTEYTVTVTCVAGAPKDQLVTDE